MPSGKGKVYIASMNLRGAWAPMPSDSIVKLNVTSAQSKSSLARRDFSPMTACEPSYKGYPNFEAFWQSGKVFEGIDPEKVKTFWRRVDKNKPKRRYPGSRSKRVLYAKFDGDDTSYGYIESRKCVYVPSYYDMMTTTESAIRWRERVASGTPVVVYDFDGPRTSDGGVQCVELTKAVLVEKINDPRHPFGHGYIVAGWLAGIEPREYC